MKKCKKCNRSKNLSDFSLNSRNKDGIQSYCKECFSSYHKYKYRKATRTKIKEVDPVAVAVRSMHDLSFIEVIDGIFNGYISEAVSQKGRVLRRYVKDSRVFVSGSANRMENVTLCDTWNLHKFNITRVMTKKLKKIQDIIKEYPDITITAEGITRDCWQFPIKQENFDIFGKIYDGNINTIEQDWLICDITEKGA